MLSKIPKKSIFLFVVSILAVFLFFELYPQKKITDEDKTRKIEQVLGRPLDDRVTDFSLGQKYDGENISFSYPNDFKLYDKLKQNEGSNVVESVRLDSDEPRMTLSVIATETDSIGKVGDIPAVGLRRSKDIYRESTLEIGGFEAVFFEKNQLEEGQQYSYEEASFLILDGKAFSFVIGAKDAEYAKKIFDEVLATVVFKTS